MPDRDDPKKPDLKVHRLPRKALKPEDVGVSIHVDLRDPLEPAPPGPRVKLTQEMI